MELMLKAIRNKKGITQENLAKKIGLTRRVISAYERKETPVPLDVACAICDTLECTLDELAGREWPRPAFQDERQEMMNESFEALNDESKSEVAGMVASIASDPARRIAVRKTGGDVPDTAHLLAVGE